MAALAPILWAKINYIQIIKFSQQVTPLVSVAIILMFTKLGQARGHIMGSEALGIVVISVECSQNGDVNI
jgi:hypothetical protein